VSTLDRYLLREASAYLLAGLLVVVLLLLGGVLFEVLAPLLSRGVDLIAVAQYLAYRVPEAVYRGLPIAYLFALLLLLSRMAEDSELKALLASGISRERVLFTLVWFGGVLALLGFLLGAEAVPRANQEARAVLQRAILARPRALLEPGTFFTDAYGRLVYIGRVDEEGIGEIRLLSKDEVLAAERGRFEHGVLELGQGVRVTYDQSRPRTVALFEKATLPLKEIAALPRAPASDLTLGELREKIARARARKIPHPALATAYYRKFAEPLASVVFAFFAVGVAFWMLGGSRSLGLVGVVTVTFFYYATWSVFRIMGEQGAIPPWLGAFGPDLFYLALALVFLGVGRR